MLNIFNVYVTHIYEYIYIYIYIYSFKTIYLIFFIRWLSISFHDLFPALPWALRCSPVPAGAQERRLCTGSEKSAKQSLTMPWRSSMMLQASDGMGSQDFPIFFAGFRLEDRRGFNLSFHLMLRQDHRSRQLVFFSWELDLSTFEMTIISHEITISLWIIMDYGSFWINPDKFQWWNINRSTWESHIFFMIMDTSHDHYHKLSWD